MKVRVAAIIATLLLVTGLQAQPLPSPTYRVGGIAAVWRGGSLLGGGASFGLNPNERLTIEGGFAAAGLDVAPVRHPAYRDLAPRRHSRITAAVVGASYRVSSVLTVGGHLYVSQNQTFDQVRFGLRSGQALGFDAYARWKPLPDTELGLYLTCIRANGYMPPELRYAIVNPYLTPFHNTLYNHYTPF